ncbi:PREDICTED: uncharacterized protein LOC107343295 [Acropora digitifera]|uniref:uncharacterized protein LOC107343295 n=1 Tax=Acropora digitifera TaxID=70779 RepID=UPI000779F747|nr:PREDICTED: uncharacterized protein LOC107343295 [Acropora digitifera]
MADANGSTRSDSAEDCLVLLEELIRSNRNLAAENEKLRQDHEKASKNQAEILQRIEERLHDREYVPRGGRHRSSPRRRGARNSVAIPAACRRSLRRMYKVLCRREDFNGFYLNEDVSSENNATIIERVIAQVLHEHGGQERCPWTRPIMEGMCVLPFIGNLQSNQYYKGYGYPWGKENDHVYR